MDDSRSAPASIPRVGLPAPDPLIGRTINDRYRIVGILARGGMGKVYRAEQQPLGRLVALKVLDPHYTGENDPEFHKRFFLEASIASKLTHPNTVTVFDYGKADDDIYYMAMELLEGRTLHRAVREEGPLDAGRTIHIGRQICRSLREAHALGVIHRDLKPANVYLVQHGDESDFVKVLDFGLVKKVEEKAGEELTQTGLFMGSPKYMAPEQIRGEPVDARVDVYALGVMMYEMLTGKVPFDSTNSVNILMAHIQEKVPSMQVFNPNVRVPPALENVVLKCMAKDPKDRYASMDLVLAALKQVAGNSSEQRLDSSEPSYIFDTHPLADSTSGRPLENPPSGALATGAQAPLPDPALAATPEHKSRTVAPFAFAVVVIALVAAGFLAMPRSSEPAPSAAQPKPLVEERTTAAAVAGEPRTGQVVPPVQASAEPAPAVANVATVLVSLRSTPPGAMVVVEGKEYGPTPTQVEWSGAEAALGREITFRFQRKGYRDLTVTRQIRGDRLDVEAPPMDPIPVRRPARDERAGSGAPKAPSVTRPLKEYKAEPY